MLFRFTSDFANNWRKDDTMPIEILPNGNFLVDNVAEIDHDELLKHGYLTDDSDKNRIIPHEEWNKEEFDAAIRTFYRYDGEKALTLENQKKYYDARDTIMAWIIPAIQKGYTILHMDTVAGLVARTGYVSDSHKEDF